MLIGTWCIESEVELLHNDKDFDRIALHLPLKVYQKLIHLGSVPLTFCRFITARRLTAGQKALHDQKSGTRPVESLVIPIDDYRDFKISM